MSACSITFSYKTHVSLISSTNWLCERSGTINVFSQLFM